MKKNTQIVYVHEEGKEDEILELYQKEALSFQKTGFLIGTKPLKHASILIYRGSIITEEKKYPSDPRYINSFHNNIDYSFLSRYYPVIADLTIETFFVNQLDESVTEALQKKKWKKAFIKRDRKALEHVEEGKSVWPKTTFEEMNLLYNKFEIPGKFCIRKYIDPNIIEKEERYWVLNGNIYHRHNKIPDVVREAAKRLNKLGSSYYTIDATPDFVVEVNPGESSDRHAVNSAELFASWFKKEFLK